MADSTGCRGPASDQPTTPDETPASTSRPPVPDAVAHHLASASDAGREFYGILRDIVQHHAPEATQEISYAMPVFLVDGKRLLHAAPWKAHLAIYPLPEERDLDPQTTAALATHSSGASTLKLLYKQPFPTELVDAVVRAHLARLADGR